MKFKNFIRKKLMNKQREKQRLNEDLKLFLGGIPGKIDKPHLIRFLKKIPGIFRIEIPIKKSKKITRGFAHLYIDTERNYNKILAKKTLSYEDRILHIKPFLEGKDLQKIRDEYEKRKLYVNEIPLSWNKQRLFEEMSNLGKITDAYIIQNPESTQSMGFGYVEFKDAWLAQKILEKGSITLGGTLINFERCSKLNAKINKEKKLLESKQLELTNNYEKAIKKPAIIVDLKKTKISHKNQTFLTNNKKEPFLINNPENYTKNDSFDNNEKLIKSKINKNENRQKKKVDCKKIYNNYNLNSKQLKKNPENLLLALDINNTDTLKEEKYPNSPKNDFFYCFNENENKNILIKEKKKGIYFENQINKDLREYHNYHNLNNWDKLPYILNGKSRLENYKNFEFYDLDYRNDVDNPYRVKKVRTEFIENSKKEFVGQINLENEKNDYYNYKGIENINYSSRKISFNALEPQNYFKNNFKQVNEQKIDKILKNSYNHKNINSGIFLDRDELEQHFKNENNLCFKKKL